MRPYALDDVLFRGIPTHRPALPVAFDGHAASDRYPEADIERAIRLVAGTHAIQKILHVRVRRSSRLSYHLGAVGPVHLLRNIADLLAFGYRAIGAQNVFSVAELI